jgi:prepilin-type N-terminal cleavage/methylation domain-containing protein
MQPMRKAAAALRREERGFTLLELLIATTVGLVVVGGALTIFIGGIRSDPRTASQVTAIQQARVTVDRITRELRQGLEIPKSPTPSSTQLAIVTYVKAATCGGAAASTAIPCRVTYTCTAGTCTRVVAQPNGTTPGPTATVASDLTSANVFSYSPDTTDPTYVGVTFSFDSGSAEPVTLGDGVALRNLEVES